MGGGGGFTFSFGGQRIGRNLGKQGLIKPANRRGDIIGDERFHGKGEFPNHRRDDRDLRQDPRIQISLHTR